MKAIQVAEYGQVERLELIELEELVPNDDQVLIDVAGSGINPIDWKILSGAMKQFIPMSFPYTPGVEVAGTIAAVGKNIHEYAVGDEVFGFIGIVGGYATQALATPDRLAHKPDGLSLVHAGGIPAAALTAWQALHEQAEIQPGQTVLIHGAAGGVGSFAVQLARLVGAHVVATGSTRNRDYLRSLGAHQFIDYTAQQFENLVSDVDTVIDLIGGETQDRSWAVIKRGGVLVSPVSTPNVQKALEYGVVGKNFATRSDGRQLAEIAKLFAEKKLHVEVEVVPLSNAAEALMLSRGGHTRGKLVFDVNR
ncbi:NADP-dependent oxidoreductase [Pseudomonas sp. OTU2001]|uniref:NADP-dependent oxidoreductase n=1 Tax=Pseudomonas sp. OTU2001 TaxID=3043859 RepID=UPI00313F3191